MPVNNPALDSLVQTYGEELMEKLQVRDKKEILEKDKMKLSYADNGPIPGQTLESLLDNQLSGINENTALDSLITKSAAIKSKQEAAQRPLTLAEKEHAKKQFVDMMMYQQGEAFYEKYHYMMDGQTKRRIRHKIEKDYDKGKYNKKATNLND